MTNPIMPLPENDEPLPSDLPAGPRFLFNSVADLLAGADIPEDLEDYLEEATLQHDLTTLEQLEAERRSLDLDPDRIERWQPDDYRPFKGVDENGFTAEDAFETGGDW